MTKSRDYQFDVAASACPYGKKREHWIVCKNDDFMTETPFTFFSFLEQRMNVLFASCFPSHRWMCATARLGRRIKRFFAVFF